MASQAQLLKEAALSLGAELLPLGVLRPGGRLCLAPLSVS